MHTLNTLIVIAIATFGAGLILGMLINSKRNASKQSQQQLEAHLSELQQQQETYQSEVTSHFTQTAELLDQLTNSYRDVHNHLAKGAQILASNSAGEALKALPEEDSDTEEHTSTAEQLNPPLDYAPKAQNEEGMLSESFGLKNSEEKKPETQEQLAGTPR